MKKSVFEKIISIKKKFEENVKENVRFRKLLLSAFCVVLLVFSLMVLNYKDLVKVYALEKDIAKETKDMKIIVGGEAVGIKLLATGVLVMGLDRTDTNLQIGDIILSVNDNKIESNVELMEYVKNSNGESLKLEVTRKENRFVENITPQKDEISGEYKLGLWVKDSSAGVGTVTFYEANSMRFAALGHGVTETKENYVLPITAGGITKTNIFSVQKGISKIPGELKGSITNKLLGEITGNTDKGVYGKITDKEVFKEKQEIEILNKSKVKEGKASIICTLDDNVAKEYEISIEKVLLTSTGNKNIIIRVTDKRLLEKTGGIIQGMSGSPIIQDSKLVGAITHVFLNDPTMGYGVFVENMIEDMCNVD